MIPDCNVDSAAEVEGWDNEGIVTWEGADGGEELGSMHVADEPGGEPDVMSLVLGRNPSGSRL